MSVALKLLLYQGYAFDAYKLQDYRLRDAPSFKKDEQEVS